MAVILFDDNAYQQLLPLTFTRPLANLRVGILTIAEKWGKHLAQDFSYHTRNYLQGKFPIHISADNLFINGGVCPDDSLLDDISKLPLGHALRHQGQLIAVRLGESDALSFEPDAAYTATEVSRLPVIIRYPEYIFRFNDIELRKDYNLLTKGRESAQISNTNTIIGTDFFAEEGAIAECSTFNTQRGPIYLAANSEVWEGVNIRGAFALCEHSSVKMGAKIYGATTIGPYSRVGGEINNSVLWGFSNKGHDGYLGNSVLGEWCNMGADSNNSNLKNNYGEVKLWDYTNSHPRKTGLQFCGLIMADHSKCGINTMFNTGTVVGVGCNVFGGGFPPNFVPDFSWGGGEGLEDYRLDKMLETTARVFDRRDGRDFDENELGILNAVYNLTHPTT